MSQALRRYRMFLSCIVISFAPPLMAQPVTAEPVTATQDAATPPVADGASAGAAEPASTPAACPPKKKQKGLGLGGLLKAAQQSGLTSMVGGGVLGQTGSVAVNTAIGVAGTAAASAPPAKPQC